MRTNLAVQRAVILAAGNGDRFHSTALHSKLLATLAGMPLINRTILTAARAGITLIDIIVGYQADAVQAAVEEGVPSGVAVRFHYNDHWHEENGISALVARPHVGGDRFALLMGDHVFAPRVLQALTDAPVRRGESLLAVDRAAVTSPAAAEATKVRLEGDRITAIGKEVSPFDALDTGVFVFSPSLFGAIEESVRGGDTSLSGGVMRLAARGLIRGVDTDGSAWYDIDTVADLELAHIQSSDGNLKIEV